MFLTVLSNSSTSGKVGDNKYTKSDEMLFKFSSSPSSLLKHTGNVACKCRKSASNLRQLLGARVDSEMSETHTFRIQV